MDKSAIRNFAIEARKILMKSAITEAGFYGITKDGCKFPIQKGQDFEVYETLAGTENRIFGSDIKRRANLVRAIEEQGFDQVVEETSYTWFNRIIAIRFMEVNDYLPTRVRVLSSETGSNTPDIVTQSLDVDLNMTPEELEKVQSAKDNNKYDEAFRLLFIKQCNELNDILPGLFEKTDDYMELLLKLSYTGDGVVRMLVDTVPEDSFNVETEGQVEIIGWMYQYYNTELKDDTFAKLKKNVKISKERIPAATQLFTPDWIVRYMVENSVGRIWIEHLRANDSTIDEKAKAEEFGWKYYLPEAEQEPDVQSQLVEVRKSYKDLTPMDITCIDPCMGSGHILVYMFDVLMDIYRSEGYNERDSVFDILEKNIHGLDIDRRAYQLSYFAIMMKARGYNRRLFRGFENENGEKVVAKPQLQYIEESNNIDDNHLKYFGHQLEDKEIQEANMQIRSLLENLKDAKEYGSMLEVKEFDWMLLRRFLQQYEIEKQLNFETIGIEETKNKLQILINQGSIMSRKYAVVSTNPPYMGLSNMNPKVSNYAKKNYPDSKSDMFAIFIDKSLRMVKKHGFQSMITQHSWMFLSSYKKLRVHLFERNLINMAHLGARAFEEIGGEVVQTTSFVYRNDVLKNYVGKFRRLVDGNSQKGKEEMFLEGINEYTTSQNIFQEIPGTPIAYWLSHDFVENFKMDSIGDNYIPKFGMSTGNGDLFIRMWHELDFQKIDMNSKSEQEASEKNMKWVALDKGGQYRKWYGNRYYVVLWKNNGKEIKECSKSAVRSPQFFFRPHISWTLISTGHFSARLFENGFALDTASNCIYFKGEIDYDVLGFLNSKVADNYLAVLNPTMNFSCGIIGMLPYQRKKNTEIEELVTNSVLQEKEDFNSSETSWDFEKHPFCEKGDSIEEAYCIWKQECDLRFTKLKNNEERLNSIFIEEYQLGNELTSDVCDEEITVKRADIQRDVKSFVSYAVGCMFGRYSLDKKGLIYAGSEWDWNNYSSFIPDADGIIPIMDENYFEDDIVGRFIEFVKCVFGWNKLEENLLFIANALGNKGTSSREIIRNYFLTDFFKDHCNTYSVTGSGKRPIYWLFDSGKQNGFKALIYMHRYNQDMVGLIRSDYLHKAQDAVEGALKNSEYILSSSTSAVDKARATKLRDKYIKQINETKIYYQALSHVALQRIELDLDDGVKVNYAKFQGVEVSNEGTKKQTIDLLAKI